MNLFEILLVLLAVIVGLPILAYMVMKFGVAGYYRGKHHAWKKQTNQNKTNIHEIE